ncbi:MAG: CU044_5270 family protein [Streptosporangiaceae bacterium]|jgi:hypothetical protein
MTDLAEPGPVRELAGLRADVAGRAPEALHRARGRLLAEIHNERDAVAPSYRALPSRSTSRLRRAFPHRAEPRPSAPRWLRPALLRPVLLAAAVAGAVAAVTVSLLPGPAAHRPPPRAVGSAPASSPASRSSVLTAAYVLNRAASAAAASSQPVPRPGQFIYVTSVTTYLSTEIGPSGEKSWLYRTSRQIWQSVDGERAGLLQIVDRGNVKLPWGPVPPADTGNPVSWNSLHSLSCPGAAPARGTYAFLASLPTNPGRLRAWIYQHPDGQNQADAQAWTDIGDMLREMLVPPKLAAALYRVAATIPGATVVPRAENAVGRASVAVSRSGAALIFDPKTYQLIGEGAVLTKAVPGQGPAGTVVASTAQLKESVVSHLPDVPPSEVEKDAGGPSC